MGARREAANRQQPESQSAPATAKKKTAAEGAAASPTGGGGLVVVVDYRAQSNKHEDSTPDQQPTGVMGDSTKFGFEWKWRTEYPLFELFLLKGVSYH